MEKNTKVFLAHASEDKGRVKEIYRRLEQAGFSPWLDELDLVPGQNWRVEIPRIIRESDIVVACFSEHSVTKQGYIQKELRIALSTYAEKPAGSIYLVPLRLDDVEIPDLRIPRLELNLRDFQWLDYWKPGGFDQLTAAISCAVSTAGSSAIPESAPARRSHLLSAKLAVTNLKRYISDERHRIALHDLVTEETNRICDAIGTEHFPADESFSDSELLDRVSRYEAAVEILQALMAYGCFWGRESHRYLWVQTLERVANVGQQGSGRVVWLRLRLYPALVLLYSGGIAAIGANNYGTLRALLLEPAIRDVNEQLSPIDELFTWRVMERPVQRRLPGKKKRRTPLSDYLAEILRDPMRSILPDDYEYGRCFDRFEYFFSLVYVDSKYGEDALEQEGGVWCPAGRFLWREFGRGYLPDDAMPKQIRREAEDSGEDWKPLQAGFFGGSLDHFYRVKGATDNFIARHSPW